MNARTLIEVARFALDRAAIERRADLVPPTVTPSAEPYMQGIIEAFGFGVGGSAVTPETAVSVVPDIYASILQLQSSVCSCPLVFYGPNGKPLERIPGNPAYLFSYANTEDTGYELMEDIVGSMLASGWGYVYLDYMGTKVPQELWVLDPTRVKMVRKKNSPSIDHWEINVQGPGGTGQQKMIVPAWQILGFPMYRGLSPVSVLRTIYTTQRNADLWLDKFYKQGAIMSGFFSTDATLLPVEDDRLKASLNKKYAGLRNAWQPVVLPKSIKFERAGLSMADMEFVASAGLTSKKIYKVFRIPSSIMGEREKGSFSQSAVDTDTLNYWQNAVIPMLSRIQTRINERLLMDLIHIGEFGAGITCQFDLSAVLALNDVRLKMLMLGFTAAGDTPTMGVNDVRRMAGVPLSPDPKHDKIPEKSAGPAAGALGAGGGAQGRAITDDRPPAERMLETTTQRLLNATPIAAMFETVEPKALQAHDPDHRVARANVLLDVAERGMARGVMRLGRQIEARVIEKLRRTHQQAGLFIDRGVGDLRMLTAAIDGVELLSPTPADRKLIRTYMRRVTEYAGANELARIGLRIAFNSNSLRAAHWLSNRSDVVIVGTTQTTRDALTETLMEGVRAKETLAELESRVSEVIVERYGGQANTIARTETVGAYNFGTWEAGKQAEERHPGLVEGKTWVNSHDDRVRGTNPKDQFSHVEADGQTVALDEPFEVSGERLMFPGDASQGASTGNVIACRCTIVMQISRARLAQARRETATRLLPEHSGYSNPGRNGTKVHTDKEVLVS